MDIILLRHGQTYDNLLGVYSEDSTRLTNKGKKQILKAKDILNEFHIENIYYSSLIRAKESFKLLNSEGVESKEIVEYNFGIFKGKTYDEIIKEYPVESNKWVRDPFRYKIPKGESMLELYNRVESFLKKLVLHDKNVLLVTHAGVIQAALSWVFDDINNFYKFKIDNGSLSVISINSDYKYLSKLNLK